MSNLVAELGLRLAKALAVAVLALVLYLVLTGVLGEPGSAVLALLCWTSAAGLWLLLETSPI